MAGDSMMMDEPGRNDRDNGKQVVQLLDSRYRVEKTLGRAFMAVHTGTGSRMIIKPKANFQDSRVIRHLSQLRHPALPRIIDEICISTQELADTYLVMEYLEGDTFAEWMQSAGGRLLPDQLLPLMAETARTLAFLHEQNQPGLLHLDLKPEHLIRLPGGHAGLIDFDNARLYPVDPIARSAIRCTTGYAAPELMMGSPVPQTDIYALGVTMLVLLTGQCMTDQVIPPLEPLCRNLPSAITTILEICLNTDPAMRYPSAAALACALENLVQLRGRFNAQAVGQNAPVLPANPISDAASEDLPVHQPLPSEKEKQRYPDQLVVIWDHALFAVRLSVSLTYHRTVICRKIITDAGDPLPY